LRRDLNATWGHAPAPEETTLRFDEDHLAPVSRATKSTGPRTEEGIARLQEAVKQRWRA